MGAFPIYISLARHNRYHEVEALLERGVPANTEDKYGNTILSIACQNGLKRLAKLALRRGADINWQNRKGNTPASFRLYVWIWRYPRGLFGYKGANPGIRNHNGKTCYEE